ncbi:hypothetical protein NS365_05570 [Aureimonas ureilytica]|uniref:Uncharacterized protein n=1 Tax=Aureimonas ureilytica TaxID=401562 RepID=A0A175RTY5_9HYPH|nr:hypothetical protein [Aureimonas ureilytica]KTR06903.1 hypothetical protein NS365_05570 [Aureimonas ureilytica]
MLNGTEVLSIMVRTLAIAIALDIAARYLLIIQIPWYATTAVLTLFMYASESSANLVTRTAIVERFNKVEDDVTEVREKLASLEAATNEASQHDVRWHEDVQHDVQWLQREVTELKRMVN